jgi:hypothetical protein
VKRLLLALVALLFSLPAFGQTNPVAPAQFGLAITSSTGLTLPTGTNFVSYASVCARGGNANYSTDLTTAPTGSTGVQLLQNQCIMLSGSAVISAFRAIQQTGNTTTLDVLYYR